MKLAFITSGLELSGGTRVIIEFANRLAARELDISIVLPRGLEDSISLEVDSRVRLFRTKTDYSGRRSRLSVSLAVELATAIPRVDRVIATHALTVGPTLFASAIMRKGSALWLYQDYLEMFEDRPLERWVLRVGPRFFDKVLVISQSCQDEVMKNSGKECVIVGEGLSDREVFVPVARKQSRATRELLTVGDARPRKGLFDFLEAAAVVVRQEPNLRLNIISKDHLSLPSDLPISIHYRPSRAELAQLYSACDVFVYAAWWESFGLPPLEAMACGAPVVLTDSRGVREFATHEYNCLMTPSRDPQALADATIRLLRDPELARRLAHKGVETAEKFDWQKPVERFEQAVLHC